MPLEWDEALTWGEFLSMLDRRRELESIRFKQQCLIGGKITAAIYNAMGGKRPAPVKPSDIFPNLADSLSPRVMTDEQIAAMARLALGPADQDEQAQENA